MKTMDLFDKIEDQSVQLQPHGVVNMKRIEELTMQKVVSQSKMAVHRRHSLGIYMLAAILITLIMATTAFAYVGFTRYENPIEMMHIFFGNKSLPSLDSQEVFYPYPEGGGYTVVLPSSERTPLDEDLAAVVAPPVAAVGQSVTWGDYTLTIQAHQHDKNLGMGTVYYTLENPKGVEGYDTQINGELWWPEGEIFHLPGCSWENFLIADESTSTKLSVACYYHGTERLEKYQKQDYVQMCFYNTQETIQLSKYASDENTVALMSENGEILISAIGMDVRMQDMEFLYDTTYKAIDGVAYVRPESSNIDYLAVEFSDGSEYVVLQDQNGEFIENFVYTSGYRDPVFGEVSTYNFNRIIDPNLITGVVINETVFPVKVCKDITLRMNMLPKADVITWEEYLSKITVTEIVS